MEVVDLKGRIEIEINLNETDNCFIKDSTHSQMH